MMKSGYTKGFTFLEVIMALVVAALALTTLMTTQGSLFKSSSRFFQSYQAITTLKNVWYEKRWQCLLLNPKNMLKKMKEKETIHDLSISFIKTAVPEQLALAKDKSIYSTTLVQLKIIWHNFGKSYDFNIPLVVSEKITLQKEDDQKVKT